MKRCRRQHFKERLTDQRIANSGTWGVIKATLVTSRPWKMHMREFRMDLRSPSQRHVATLLQLWAHVDPGESWFYERVTRDLGITVLSISHKLSLQAHHPYRLSLDGRGGWDFAKCTSTE